MHASLLIRLPSVDLVLQRGTLGAILNYFLNTAAHGSANPAALSLKWLPKWLLLSLGQFLIEPHLWPALALHNCGRDFSNSNLNSLYPAQYRAIAPYPYPHPTLTLSPALQNEVPCGPVCLFASIIHLILSPKLALTIQSNLHLQNKSWYLTSYYSLCLSALFPLLSLLALFAW